MLVDLGEIAASEARAHLDRTSARRLSTLGATSGLMHLPANTARIIFVVAVAAIVILMFATGLADDKAPPGGGGRVPVTHTGTQDSP